MSTGRVQLAKTLGTRSNSQVVHPRPLPADLTDRAFHREHAMALGVPLARLRRSDLITPLRRVRTPVGSGGGAFDRIVWNGLTLPDGQVFTHLSAARVHGLWIPPRLETDLTVHVGCTSPAARRHGRGVRGHLLDPALVQPVRVRGQPVLSPCDSWASLATTLTRDELVILGDQLVRRKKPLATMSELADVALRRTGRQGAGRLRDALSLVRPRTDSVKESELRLLVMSWGFPEPTVNPDLTDASGQFLGLGDLTYEALRLVLEYDGDHHRTDAWQFGHDIDRLDDIVAAEYRVIRVVQKHLTWASHVLRARIDRALRHAGWTP